MTQPVSGLVPGKLYELSAMVRTSGVTAAGAVTSACSVRASGSARRPSWVPTAGTRRSVQFIAEETTAVIGCRLGFWAGDSRGSVWFDDVALRTPDGMYHRASEHLELYLDQGAGARFRRRD